jgi:glycosyltransferase involved in cell wall biosynthesis
VAVIFKGSDGSKGHALDIMFVLPDLRGGGVERIWLSLAKHYLNSGLSVGICLLKRDGELLGQIPSGAIVDVLETARLRKAILPLSKVIKERSPKAIMVGVWPLPAVVYAACKLARSKAKIVASEHNDYRSGPVSRSAKLRFAMRLSMATTYRRIHSVVAVSEGAADTVSRISTIKRDNIQVIYNPIEAPTLGGIPPKRLAPEWLAHDTGRRVIAVGSLKEQKGYSDLLQAFCILRKQVDARLLILGEGQLRNQLTAQANELGIGAFLSMPGFTDNPTPFVEAADVFVLSSLWEGFGNVLVEAMAAGTKVVSTDCPSGPGEILKGTKGRLVPPSNPTALAAGILAALEEDQDVSTLRKRAAEFSVEKAAARYRALMGV